MATSRRDFLKAGGLLTAGMVTGLSLGTSEASAASENDTAQAIQDGPFTLPALGYAYQALEPHIDARTMEIHHTKHHQAYITKLNAAIEKEPSLKGKTLEQLLSGIKNVPEAVRSDIRNHGGGHWNHSFFWGIIGDEKALLSDKFSAALTRDFGSFEAFKEQFEKKAATVFGSGWGWLVKDGTGKLSIITTPNQDNPLMDVAETRATPVLGVDVWEHAYYLNYQNRRPDYLKAFWHVVNWRKVNELYEK